MTHLARGPLIKGTPLAVPSKEFEKWVWYFPESRKDVGLIEKSPQNSLGIRILPPISEPSPNGEQ